MLNPIAPCPALQNHTQPHKSLPNPIGPCPAPQLPLMQGGGCGLGGHGARAGRGPGSWGLGVRSGPGRTPSPAPLSPQHCPSAPGQANGHRPLLAWLWRRGGSVRAGKGLPKKAQPVFRVAGGDVPTGTGRWRGASTAPPPQGRAVPSPVPRGWARHVQPHVLCFSLGWLGGGARGGMGARMGWGAWEYVGKEAAV